MASPSPSPPAIQAAAQRLAEGDAAAAAVQLEALVAAAPAYPAAHALLARAYEASGRTEDALGAWHQAHVLVPNSPLVQRERQRLLEARAAAEAPAPDPPPADPASEQPAAAAPEAEAPAADGPALHQAFKPRPPAASGADASGSGGAWHEPLGGSTDPEDADEPEVAAPRLGDEDEAPAEGDSEWRPGDEATAESESPENEVGWTVLREMQRPRSGPRPAEALVTRPLESGAPREDTAQADEDVPSDEAAEPLQAEPAAAPDASDVQTADAEATDPEATDQMSSEAAADSEAPDEPEPEAAAPEAAAPATAQPSVGARSVGARPDAEISDEEAPEPAAPSEPQPPAPEASEQGLPERVRDEEAVAEKASVDEGEGTGDGVAAGGLDAPVTDDLDVLIQQLEDAPRIRPDPDFSGPAVAFDEDIADDMVSETLARIYAAQGQFAEAAAVYEKLAQQRPGEAEALLEKAAELRARDA